MEAVKVKTASGVDLLADYDRPTDVLYVVLGAPVPSEGEGQPGGVELDFSLRDNSPCAVTIIGFNQNGWQKRRAELVKIISRHLSIPTDSVAYVVNTAVTNHA